MRAHGPSVRWLAAVLPTIVVLGVIAAGGLQPIARRSFSLRSPNQFSLVTLGPARGICEGPIRSPRPFDAVSIWGATPTGSADLRIAARDANTGRLLGEGQLTARHVETEQRTQLGRRVATQSPVRVCVRVERGAFTIAGSQAVDPRVALSGKLRGQEFSLLLLAGHHSLLDSLPLAFSRAALFRPSWVGVWTYWGLALGLVLALAVIALTLIAAAAADDTTRDR